MLPGGSTPIRPITDRPSLAPSSFTRRPIGFSCESLSLAGRRRAYHVPPMCTVWVRSRLSAGGASSAPEEFGAPGPDHVPFGPSVSASCAWSLVTTFISASPELTCTTRSWFPTALMLAVAASASRLGRPPRGGGYVVPGASHLTVTVTHVPVGYCWQNSRSCQLSEDSMTVTATTSCRTRTGDYADRASSYAPPSVFIVHRGLAPADRGVSGPLPRRTSPLIHAPAPAVRQFFRFPLRDSRIIGLPHARAQLPECPRPAAGPGPPVGSRRGRLSIPYGRPRRGR